MKLRTGIRQGDVMVVPAAGIPKNATALPPDGNRVVLAHGEVTGHCHAIYGRATMFRADEGGGGVRYLDVPEAGEALKHEEHRTHQIPAGPHIVIQQREYDLMSGVRNVAD
ncbi:MAG TPA: hypothetical protein VHA07_09990 [Devosia sp.]|nr:hypothetical protein [Devosia sp.]